MFSVGLDFERRELAERVLPDLEAPQGDGVLFRVHEVGVCGTDRELAKFHFGSPPEGESFLTIGHEALGQVVACGPAVRNLKAGDWIAPTVRRPCRPLCVSCARGRVDLCTRGRYRERGIVGLHGYFRSYAMDAEDDLVRVPPELAGIGVLLEPLSVVEKAVEMALRYHEPGARKATVLGAGPVGILCGLALLIRGLEVTVQSLEPDDGPRAQLVREAGLRYGRGPDADIVIEATGAPEAILLAIELLAPLGVCVILGAKDPVGKLPFSRMVLFNQTVAGSVNSSPQAWLAAAADLGKFPRTTLEKMIHRLPARSYRESLLGNPLPQPKTVHVME